MIELPINYWLTTKFELTLETIMNFVIQNEKMAIFDGGM